MSQTKRNRGIRTFTMQKALKRGMKWRKEDEDTDQIAI